ncbi:methyltransferase family protein [Thalassotalea euphylliae]|uniref:methyltransferase family protein n=1 Tax=Thalassotalea euphylliae TaxID=1655234 RepID=UPI00362963CB
MNIYAALNDNQCTYPLVINIAMLALKIPPVVLVFICCLLMWIVQAVTPELLFQPPQPILLFLAFSTLGFAFALAGVLSFKRAQTTVNPMTPDSSSSLVVSGIYSVTRNPMYIGFLCFLIGFAFFLSHYLAFIWCAGFIWYMNKYQIAPEEHALTKIFGEEYKEYCLKTRRWL